MTIDVNVIERNIYEKLCKDFSEKLDNKFQRYVSVLEFLKTVEIKDMIEPNTTKMVYESYCEFCHQNGYEPLIHTIFSRTVAECGFSVVRRMIDNQRIIYFAM